jgi:hypothetical protein
MLTDSVSPAVYGNEIRHWDFSCTKGFSSYNPSAESGHGPSSIEDLKSSTPIIPEWKVAHDFSQTCIQTSREAEDAHGQ